MAAVAVDSKDAWGPAALTEFLQRHDYTGRHDGDEAEAQAVRRSLPRVRELLVAERVEAVALINRVLAGATVAPQLRRHGQVDWHLHFIDDERALDERILVETAMAMVDVVRADETSRLGRCADQECQGLVLDLSRNRSKRYCSTACGNRNAVAAYRARQR